MHRFQHYRNFNDKILDKDLHHIFTVANIELFFESFCDLHFPLKRKVTDVMNTSVLAQKQQALI